MNLLMGWSWISKFLINLLKLELSRACTPHASAASAWSVPCIDMTWILSSSMLTIFTYTLVHVWSINCAHEQKAHGLQLIGMANKNSVFVIMTLVDLAKRFKTFVVKPCSFSPILTGSLYFRVTRMPRSGDLAIFVMTDDDIQTKRLLYP